MRKNCVKGGNILEKQSCSEIRLKSENFKITKSRKAVLDILMEQLEPITAEQIFLMLKEKNMRINLSTIYRTLESFEKKEIVTKVNIIEENKMLFEYNRLEHQHYLMCISCKKIITIQKCPLKEYERELKEELHFMVTKHKLYLYGYCEECQKKLQQKCLDVNIR